MFLTLLIGLDLISTGSSFRLSEIEEQVASEDIVDPAAPPEGKSIVSQHWKQLHNNYKKSKRMQLSFHNRCTLPSHENKNPVTYGSVLFFFCVL